MKRSFLLVFSALLLIPAVAHATLIKDSGEPTLQSIINGLITNSPPATAVDALGADNDAIENDAYWQIVGGQGITTMVIEVAGFATTNSFGIYDKADPAKYVQLFGGSDSAGSRATLSITGGLVSVNGESTGVFFAGDYFGFYLDARDQKNGKFWFSDPIINDGESDHMVAFQGDNIRQIEVHDYAGLWGDTDFILGWEDLKDSKWDQDYQDMVLFVQNVAPYTAPVPEPATMLLFGTGLIGLAGLGRRKFLKK